MCEAWVQSQGWEDAQEGRMATHSSILAWRIPWTEEPGRLQCMQTWLSNYHYKKEWNNAICSNLDGPYL